MHTFHEKCIIDIMLQPRGCSCPVCQKNVPKHMIRFISTWIYPNRPEIQKSSSSSESPAQDSQMALSFWLSDTPGTDEDKRYSVEGIVGGDGISNCRDGSIMKKGHIYATSDPFRAAANTYWKCELDAETCIGVPLDELPVPVFRVQGMRAKLRPRFLTIPKNRTSFRQPLSSNDDIESIVQ